MKLKFTFLLLLTMIFVVFNLSAQLTLHVSVANGDDGNTGITPDAPFATVQKALAIARLSNFKEVIIKIEVGGYRVNRGLLNPEGNTSATFLLQRHIPGSPVNQAGKKLKVLGGYNFVTGVRDISLTTILMGELDDPDNPNPGRALHVAQIADISPESDSIIIEGIGFYGGRAGSTENFYSSLGGGLLMNDVQSEKVVLRNCWFWENAAYNGAGLAAITSKAQIQNCVFENNRTIYGFGIIAEFQNGGGIFSLGSTLKVDGCVFSGNSAFDGAGVYGAGSSKTYINNCTFTRNAKGEGTNVTSIFSVIETTLSAGSLDMTNSIIWGNAAMGSDHYIECNGGNLFFSNNMYQKSGDAIYANGPVYLETDPNFVDINNLRGPDERWFTEDDGLRLNPCVSPASPALNGGATHYWPPDLLTDIAGQQRVIDGTIDIGAYESPAAINYWIDNDGDGYGANNPQPVPSACPKPGYTTRTGDCDDNDNTVYPGAPEICDNKDNNCNGFLNEGVPFIANIPDADGDGYGDSNGLPRLFCGIMAGYSSNNLDCDDHDKDIHPGATEICGDGKDNNCDGRVDDNGINYYLDTDGDGYGKTDDVITSCTPVAGRVIQSGDCDDNDNTVHPGAPDICDGKDNDCNGYIDEDFSLHTKYYRDVDGDGFGNGLDFLFNCSPLQGRVTKDGDCNDNDNTIYPGAPELCDGKDNNCNQQMDENLAKTTYYTDLDGDGYGNTSTAMQNCIALSQWITVPGDCDDNDNTIYPGAGGCAALPLTLVDFTVREEGKKAVASWTTTDEVNTHHFDLEKSADGNQFLKIATIPAMNAPGDHTYSYIDPQPFAGKNYYRIKMVDLDGTYTYSRIASLHGNDTRAVSAIYPNPANDIVNVVIEESSNDLSVQLISIDGKLIQTKRLAVRGTYQLNVAKLPAGIYFIKVSNGETYKLIKQ